MDRYRGGAIFSVERIDRGHRHHSHAQNKNRFKKKLKRSPPPNTGSIYPKAYNRLKWAG